ncbi:signal recognition particle-docking protein FtsY [Mesomycoplasma hyorhinis]|uniref:signal recognition particle-docking protein FtsY n=1 Tax=Mesomycoplasma hyorhinis TaxID=2100 RepID=UPI0011BBF986|nr:signal recognition particle-docking protein FtsY [Mesomycoplasma hyorhinis]
MSFFKRLKEKIFGRSKTDEEKQLDEITKQRKEVEKQKQELKEEKIDKYVAGLTKANISLSEQLIELQRSKLKVDEEYFEQLEEILIMSDISPFFVDVIIDELKKEVKKQNISDSKLINELIADKMYTIYANRSIINTHLNIKDGRLNIILMIGVNGSGKTTSISKIANQLKKEGKKILIAAGDTFRAAAVEQLEIWANRVGADILKPSPNEFDPGSVVYRAIEKAESENYDVLIIDTAGRLQNKVNLMNELKKVNKVIQNKYPDAPHESLLVLDATTGQNGISQAKHFKEATPVSGIVLTKMDGTSKGGIIFSIKDELDMDVKLIGLGEKMDDLQEFNLDNFIYALTKDLIKEYEQQ